MAKYFPESVNDEITDPVVQRFFWKQIRHGIITDAIYCPPELCILFGAQACQGIHGDFNSEVHGAVGTVDPEAELPQRVLNQHGLNSSQWEDRIKNAWMGLKGTPSQTAISDYLNIAQDLEQYGITYFEVTNKKGTRLWLGIHNLGMDVYEFNNR